MHGLAPTLQLLCYLNSIIWIYLHFLRLIGLLCTISECRPCSDSEMVKHFCSSDFVARGFITGVSHDAKMQRTVIDILASKVLSQTTSVFSPEKSSNSKLLGTKSSSSLSNKHNFDVLYDKKKKLRGKVHYPLVCGAKSGPGEYLFLGSIRLGDPVLKCAPKIQDWERVVKKAQASAHCELHTW